MERSLGPASWLVQVSATALMSRWSWSCPARDPPDDWRSPVEHDLNPPSWSTGRGPAYLRGIHNTGECNAWPCNRPTLCFDSRFFPVWIPWSVPWLDTFGRGQSSLDWFCSIGYQHHKQLRSLDRSGRRPQCSHTCSCAICRRSWHADSESVVGLLYYRDVSVFLRDPYPTPPSLLHRAFVLPFPLPLDSRSCQFERTPALLRFWSKVHRPSVTQSHKMISQITSSLLCKQIADTQALNYAKTIGFSRETLSSFRMRRHRYDLFSTGLLIVWGADL